jgi:nucleotide-binding universal stress UspA family protein
MHAQCPVVVVREETSAVTREVAVGVRDPHDTTATLAFAFEEAALRDATLVVVHSCYSLPSAPSGSWATAAAARVAADAEQAEASVGQDLADALGKWQDKYPDVRVRLDVVHGHPARTLASYSGRADLVVIGRHTAPGAGPVIGGMQHAVLYHAHGPVAIVPSDV